MPSGTLIENGSFPEHGLSIPVGGTTIEFAGTFDGATVRVKKKIAGTFETMLDIEDEVAYTVPNAYSYPGLRGGDVIQFEVTGAGASTKIPYQVSSN